jgi:hypothetical protein
VVAEIDCIRRFVNRQEKKEEKDGVDNAEARLNPFSFFVSLNEHQHSPQRYFLIVLTFSLKVLYPCYMYIYISIFF